MPQFLSEGISIAYETWGAGKPVLMIHGFGSNARVNWVETGWVETITEAGYQAIAFDNRGHGQSEKLYDPELYPARKMARDAVNLLDHLGMEQAALLGYSMGARISAFACIDAPQRVAAAIFGGLGIAMVNGLGGSDEIVAALRADSLAEVTGRVGRSYRIFAEHTKSDLEALATCMQSSREQILPSDLGKLDMPVLVAVGSEDEVGGRPEPLAEMMPKGEALVIERRDHMRATGDRQFKAGALEFLDRVW